MDKDALIAQLRAALSWQIADKADDPAFQAVLELERDKDPRYHINPLGIYTDKYQHLFEEQFTFPKFGGKMSSSKRNQHE